LGEVYYFLLPWRVRQELQQLFPNDHGVAQILSSKKLPKTLKPAALGATDIKAVMDVGAP